MGFSACKNRKTHIATIVLTLSSLFKILTICRSALVSTGGPLSALAVWKGSSVSIFIDAASLVLTPDALLLSAVGARAELSTAVCTQWHLNAGRLARYIA